MFCFCSGLLLYLCCVSYVSGISRLSILDMVYFCICVVCPMLPVSLDCPFLIWSTSVSVLCVLCYRSSLDCPFLIGSLRFPLTFILFYKSHTRALFMITLSTNVICMLSHVNYYLVRIKRKKNTQERLDICCVCSQHIN